VPIILRAAPIFSGAAPIFSGAAPIFSGATPLIKDINAWNITPKNIIANQCAFKDMIIQEPGRIL
jgi:hypothetical protein